MALTDNLSSYWKLDEASGNAADSVGSKTLTNTSGTYAAAKINNGWSGSGSTTYLANTSMSLGVQANYTIAFWFKLTSSARGDWVDFEKADFTSVIQIESNGLSTGTSAGRICFNIWNGTNHFVDCTTTGLNDGNWHFFVATVTSTTNVQLYIDGATAGSGTNGVTATLDYLSICGDKHNAANYVNGSVDEFAVWLRALSGSEVTALYNGGAGLQWPFVTSTLGASLMMALL